jgi:hypothetical protein
LEHQPQAALTVSKLERAKLLLVRGRSAGLLGGLPTRPAALAPQPVAAVNWWEREWVTLPQVGARPA